MKAPITQTKAWQKLQDDLGEISFFEQGNDYQYLAILKETPVGKYLYLPYGPVIKDKKGFENALKTLKNLAKKHKAIFIRVEPQCQELENYLSKNAKKSKDLNPKETWVLGLTPEKSEIIKNFSQGTRTRYNNYAKKGLKVLKTTDPSKIEYLVLLQRKLARERHIGTFSKKYLKTELEQPFASLYLVEYSPDRNITPNNNSAEVTPLPKPGQIIAASLFFDYKNTRYYMQSAADGDYKRLPATVALLTEAIFDAKEKGIKQFDFWGIAPEGAPKTHPWYGFTEFKKSFGGESKQYAGTYDIVLNPAKYKLYELTRKLNRLRRRH